MSRSEPYKKSAYRHIEPVTTRWADNDQYGHLNNVVYFALFDSVVNKFLIDNGLLDETANPGIFLVVHNSCDYFAEAAYPEPLDIGLGVGRLGGASVTYHLGVFRRGIVAPIAQGRFVHVHVDRLTRTSTPIPAATRAVLERLHLPA